MRAPLRAIGGCVVIVLALTVAAGAQTIDQVPVPVASTPATDPTAAPTAVPSAIGGGLTSNDWSFNEPPLAGWLDALVGNIFRGFTTIINGAVAIAQQLFLALALINLAWTAVRWAMSSTPLEEIVADAYQRLVRLAIIYVLIGMAFVGPGGNGLGWFPLIVNTIIAFAQSASGVSVAGAGQGSGLLTLFPSSTSSGPLMLSGYTPGDVFTIFWNCATFTLKSAFTGQSIANLITGAFTGATGLWMVTALIAAFSALGILVLGCRVAFKYFLTLFKAYVIAAQSYLLGLLGFDATSALGTGVFNAAINLGIETGAMIIVVGIFKTFLIGAITLMNIGFAFDARIAQSSSAIGVIAGSAASQNMTDAGVRFVAILMLDALVVLWAYAMELVPEYAAHALSGRLDVRPGEFLSRAASGSGVVRLAGAAASAGVGVAGGMMAVRALGTGAAAAGSAGSAPMADRLRAAAVGGVQGGIMAGGPMGAVGGALQAFAAGGARGAPTSVGSVFGGGSGGGGGSTRTRARAPGPNSSPQPPPGATSTADAAAATTVTSPESETRLIGGGSRVVDGRGGPSGSTTTGRGANTMHQQQSGGQQQGAGGPTTHHTAHNTGSTGGSESSGGGGGQSGDASASSAPGGISMRNMMQMQMYRQLLGLNAKLNPPRPSLDTVEHPAAQVTV